MRKNILVKAITLALGVNLLSVPLAMSVTADTPVSAVVFHKASAAQLESAPLNRSVVVTGNIQSRLDGKDWDPANKVSEMSYVGNGLYTFTCDLPEGNYFYKISLNGSWAENYGLNGSFDGRNLQLQLNAPQKITFYYNDITHQIRESTSYQLLNQEDLPVLTGDFGSLVLQDLSLDQFYQAKASLTPGTYQVTVSQQGQAPITKELHIRQSGTTTFYYDGKTKNLIADDGTIQEQALLHDSWQQTYRSSFEPIKAGQSITLGIRTAADNVDKADLILYKAVITANGGDEYNADYKAGTSSKYPLTKQKTADGYDYWQTTITPTTNGIYGYKFVLNDSKEYGDDAKSGHTGITALRDAKPFQLTVYTPDFHTPDWAKEAVVCQIFPDRFFNGDKSNDRARTTARGNQKLRHVAWDALPSNTNPDPKGEAWTCNDFFGGDLAGVTKKLDYLKDMGITAIYFNPILSASSNHRYDTRNYEELDPILGNMSDFDQLVTEMNKRGMRLIMDGVFNHVGDDSIYFDRYSKYPTVGAYEYWSRTYDLMNKEGLSQKDAEAKARQQLIAEGQIFSPYHFENWFKIENRMTEDENGKHYAYHDWQSFSSLIPFEDIIGGPTDPVPGAADQLNNKDLANYLIHDKDSIIARWFDKGLSGWRLDVANEVSGNFWQAVRDRVKKITTKHGDEPLLLGEIWQDGSQFLTGDQFDSVMNYKLSFAIGDLFLNQGNAAACDEELTILRQNYPKEAIYDLMNIVDSHDTFRAIYKFGGGKDGVKQATLQDFDYNLGKSRLKMAVAFLMGYPGMPTLYYADETGQYGSADPDCRRTFPWGKEDKELQHFFKTAIAARNQHKDIFVYGDVQTLKADGNIYAFQRQNGNKHAVVILNRGEAATTELQVNVPDGTVFIDLLDKEYKTTAANGKLTAANGANQARMLLQQ